MYCVRQMIKRLSLRILNLITWCMYSQIQRYNTLSALYSQIGFRRKAAFFKRVSGMHCVVPDSSPCWSQCYDLLLQSMEGYSLSVNPREINTGEDPLQDLSHSRKLNVCISAEIRGKWASFLSLKGSEMAPF